LIEKHQEAEKTKILIFREKVSNVEEPEALVISRLQEYKIYTNVQTICLIISHDMLMLLSHIYMTIFWKGHSEFSDIDIPLKIIIRLI